MGWGKYLRPARSGEVVWGPERVRPGTYSASPVLADGKIYVTSEDGVTSVVEAGPRFKLVAENELEGYVLTGHLGGADLCPNGEVPVLHRRAPALVRATFHVPRCRSWVLGSGNLGSQSGRGLRAATAGPGNGAPTVREWEIPSFSGRSRSRLRFGVAAPRRTRVDSI